MNVVRDLGCRVAIDDFGAGFTSFRNLQALTVDMVKIDGSFVLNLSHNVDNQLFVRKLMGLADTFGLETVAEFVENADDADFLVNAGVGSISRTYTVKLQDRIIMLEMKVRCAEILPAGQDAALAKLTPKQIVACGLPVTMSWGHLLDRAVRDKLKPAEIKAAIKTWRPDPHRT